MKIKIDLTLFAILIVSIVIIVITLSIIMTNVAYSNAQKENFNNTELKKQNVNNKNKINSKAQIIDKSAEEADAQKYLLLIVTQRVLEKVIKENERISFMAIYLDDGTIIAHFKPERIGRNMFDVDVEFKNYMQDIFYAMSNRITYKGIRYDPLFHQNMKFIVKPLKILNFDENLTLLIGMNESDVLVGGIL
jgi:signal transduction histidine kinase